VTISRATRADLDQLVALGCAFIDEHGHDGDDPREASSDADAERVRAGMAPLLDDDRLGLVLVAHRGPSIIGYAVVCWSWSVEIGGFEVVLDEVYTTERNAGIGSRLIGEIERECRNRGVRRIFLETERRNHRVRQLYTRLGYTEDDSIWMSKIP
ncbi:MAG: GNAT family N-acetyltransferase, partial [Actinomycetota bacterium]|nr:GNAT family N-acetyltransferase [Actinomycetota bacterium]